MLKIFSIAARFEKTQVVAKTLDKIKTIAVVNRKYSKIFTWSPQKAQSQANAKLQKLCK